MPRLEPNPTESYMMSEIAKENTMYLVIMREGSCYIPGPGGPPEDPLTPHTRYMFDLRRLGKIASFGSVRDNTDIKEIVVFQETDKQVVQTLMNEDPDVRSKRMTFEMHPWTVHPKN